MTSRTSIFPLACAITVTLSLPVFAQNVDELQPGQTVTRGTVVSASPNTLVIRGDQDDYQLFVLDAETTRPAQIPLNATVAVTFVPSRDRYAPSADVVRITELPSGESSRQGLLPQDNPVPVEIRRMESDIQRQARRYRVGVRSGATLDPELVLLGVQSQLGPFFSDNVFARPNLQLGFGEVTTLVALNLEGMYRLPIAPQRNRWSVYVGAGPALNFSKLGFSAEGEDNDRFDFDDLDLDAGFNVFLGIQSWRGLFLELKGGAYSSPHLRFELGYNFY